MICVINDELEVSCGSTLDAVSPCCAATNNESLAVCGNCPALRYVDRIEYLDSEDINEFSFQFLSLNF